MPKRIVVRNEGDMFQRDTKTAVDRLANIPLLDGRLLEDVALTTSASRVYHNLGRPVVGFWVVWTEGDTRVWVDGLNTSTFIELRANASSTVNLWVF